MRNRRETMRSEDRFFAAIVLVGILIISIGFAYNYGQKTAYDGSLSILKQAVDANYTQGYRDGYLYRQSEIKNQTTTLTIYVNDIARQAYASGYDACVKGIPLPEGQQKQTVGSEYLRRILALFGL